MNIVDSYSATRLSPPISMKASWKLHALLWGGGAFLLGSSLYALVTADDVKIQVIAAVGIPFFSLCLFLIAASIWRGRRRGLVELSDDGIWLAGIGKTIPWRAIGPAWVMPVGKTREVYFVVRNASNHLHNLDFVGRILTAISRKAVDVGKGGPFDWGIKTLFAMDSGSSKGLFENLAGHMEETRSRLKDSDHAIALHIPTPLRFGVPADHIVAVINAETTRRTSQSARAMDGKSAIQLRSSR